LLFGWGYLALVRLLPERAGRLHPHLDRTMERRAPTVRVAQDRRRDPGEPRCALPANLRLRTLA